MGGHCGDVEQRLDGRQFEGGRVGKDAHGGRIFGDGVGGDECVGEVGVGGLCKVLHEHGW